MLAAGEDLDGALRSSRCAIARALSGAGRPAAGADQLAALVASGPPRERVAEVLAGLRRSGARVVTWRDEDYPASLRAIDDAPPVLFVRGAFAESERRQWPGDAVAVVGARRATPSGVEIASWLAGGLAARGVCVVSGLARGIDAAAHAGALAGGGTTIAVLGSGFERLYPPEHASLADSVARSGALVSEFVPDTPALPEFFPRRNRIIAGLAKATVVVEASAMSGALVTARLAMEQGREVLAVPRDPLQQGSEGPNALLADGAAPARSADDVLAAIGRTRTAAGPPERVHAEPPSGVAGRVLSALDGRPRSLDDLAGRFPDERTSSLLAVLSSLEVDGLIERLPGPRFRRSAPGSGRRS
jgi:DNA processing protein